MAGPRTKEKDNQFPGIKIALRKWAVSLTSESKIVLDVYGGYGMMYRHVWKKYEYAVTSGDAESWLENNDLCYNVFDIDPYSSPFEALSTISYKSNHDFVFVCTDGMLRRQAGMRGNLTKFLQSKMGWPAKDNDLFARIFYNYPSYLRLIIKTICPDHTLQRLAVKYGQGNSYGTCYFAGLLERK